MILRSIITAVVKGSNVEARFSYVANDAVCTTKGDWIYFPVRHIFHYCFFSFFFFFVTSH